MQNEGTEEIIDMRRERYRTSRCGESTVPAIESPFVQKYTLNF